MSVTTETSTEAQHNIEVEQKCAERRKWRDNASITDNNDDKDERANIIYEDRDKRRVADLEHQNQHFKLKAYYKASNEQRSINNRQEKVYILEYMLEAEREDGQQKMHCLKEELDETRKKSSETEAEKRCDELRQIYETEEKVYAKAEKAEDKKNASRRQVA